MTRSNPRQPRHADSTNVSICIHLLCRAVIFVPVLIWVALAHFFPALNKLWNPLPMKVSMLGRRTSENDPVAHGFVTVNFEIKGEHHARQLNFTVDQPDKLQHIRRSNLWRIVCHFEKSELHVLNINIFKKDHGPRSYTSYNEEDWLK